ncbi:MAG: HAMP domain-containing sensor histidine kinase, partial [Gemmatimonadota bacterium]|nr:HAMP domain-containing sensor histidine kinase [Gemmatimonadota bacterium]
NSLSNSVIFAQAMLAAITLAYGSAFFGLWVIYRRPVMRAVALAWVGLGTYSALTVLTLLREQGRSYLAGMAGLALEYVVAVLGAFTALAVVHASYAVVTPDRPRRRLLRIALVVSVLLCLAVAIDLEHESVIRLVVLGALGSALVVAVRAAPSPGRRSMIIALALLILRPFFSLLAMGDTTRFSQPAWYTGLQFAVTLLAGFFTTVAVFSIEREHVRREKSAYENTLALSQRSAALGRMASSIAHDFNNVLAAVYAASDSAADDAATPQDRREAARDVEGAVERGRELTRRLLAFAHPAAAHIADFDPAVRLDALRSMIGRVAERKVSVEINLPDGTPPATAPVYADAFLFDQMIVNMSANARDAMPDGGTLRIGCDVQSFPVIPGESRALKGRYVRVTVADSGIGMDKATADRIFDPFFTTKPTGKGNGLGLSSAFSFVVQAQGHITVKSSPGHGAEFTIFLPVLDSPRA